MCVSGKQAGRQTGKQASGHAGCAPHNDNANAGFHEHDDGLRHRQPIVHVLAQYFLILSTHDT